MPLCACVVVRIRGQVQGKPLGHAAGSRCALSGAGNVAQDKYIVNGKTCLERNDGAGRKHAENADLISIALRKVFVKLFNFVKKCF